MDFLTWSSVFVISLAALLFSAKFFTDSAEKIGLHFKIPPFIIGVTIIALGTSLPEIATSITSVLQGHSEIVIGNVAGSNIANILLVLGITAIVGNHLFVNKDIIKIDLPILLGSTVFLYITTLDGQFTYIDGILALILLISYIAYNTTHKRPMEEKGLKEIKKMKQEEKKTPLGIWPFAILLISSAALYFSANYTIESVVKLGEILNIATEIIAISAVAVGTSLPELAVSAIAAKQGKADIAIGNVTGSNIFNALGVMGVPAFFGPLTIPENIISITIPILLFITILYVFMIMDKEITKWEGITLVMLYAAFIGKTFGFI